MRMKNTNGDYIMLYSKANELSGILRQALY